MSVPVLGFGVSGPHAGFVAPAITRRLILDCLAQSFGLFDTAPFYGDAETRLGSALREWRGARPVVCTKVGTERRDGRIIKDFSATGLLRSVDQSRRALGVDVIDILLLHGPAPELAQDDRLVSTLLGLKSSGSVRLLGICGRGLEVDAFAGLPWIDVIQAPLACAPVAERSGKGFMVIEALRSARTDWRVPTRAADFWYVARAMKQRLVSAGAAEERASRPPGDRLAAALSTSAVSCVVVTTTRRAHLAQNMAVSRKVVSL